MGTPSPVASTTSEETPSLTGPKSYLSQGEIDDLRAMLKKIDVEIDDWDPNDWQMQSKKVGECQSGFWFQIHSYDHVSLSPRLYLNIQTVNEIKGDLTSDDEVSYLRVRLNGEVKELPSYPGGPATRDDYEDTLCNDEASTVVTSSAELKKMDDVLSLIEVLESNNPEVRFDGSNKNLSFSSSQKSSNIAILKIFMQLGVLQSITGRELLSD